MEPSKCDMEKRQSPRVLATGRRNIYIQGETCDQLPNNLFAECLNVEEKIFVAVLARRMLTFLATNQ